MRRWRGLLVRKGRFYPVPSAPPVQVQQDAPPVLVTRRRRGAALPRRGSFQPAPPGPSGPLSLIGAQRRPVLVVRGGRFAPVPQSVQLVPVALPPVRSPRRAPVPTIRRGTFWPVVPVSSPVIDVPVERGGMSPVSHATASMRPTIRSGAAMRATST